jgi:hypothetical protein
MRIGEHSLLPALRRAGGETVIVADGFSCKTQVEQAGIGRRALHVSEVVQLALDHGPAGPRGAPEAAARPRPPASQPRRAARVAAAAVAVPALALVAGRLLNRV